MDEIIYDSFPDTKLLGAIRAVTGIKDAVAIVHGRSCCHADNLLFNVLTSPNDDIRLLGSGMRLQDISVGGHRKLSIAIRSAYEQFSPALIAVMVASVPTLMGDDVEGTLMAMQKEVPCTLAGFPCAGYQGRMADGYEEVLVQLVSYMEAGPCADNTVNLIGFKSDEPHGAANLKEIRRILENQGITINAVLTASSFEAIKRAPRAALNVVLAGDGLNCACMMEERFDVPYVTVPYPYGWRQTVAFIREITQALGGQANEDVLGEEQAWVKGKLQKIYTFLQGIYGQAAAVVGEGGRAFHLARFLSDEMGLCIKLLAVTSENPTLDADALKASNGLAQTLLITPDHFRMREVIRDEAVELIFGSSMEKKTALDLKRPLIRTAYPVLDEVAVSDVPYIGFKGTVNLVEKVINAVIGS